MERWTKRVYRSREVGFTVLAASLAASCAGSAQFESTGTSSAALKGGTDDTVDLPHANTTVFLSPDWIPAVNTNVGKCSGTLVAPNVVVTAKHCLEGMGPQPYVGVGTLADIGGPLIRARRSVFIPVRQGLVYPVDALDLALVFLDPRALDGEVGKNGVVGSTWERILKTDIRRPSFQANYLSTDPNRGVAGWGRYGNGSPANWERTKLLGANTSPTGLRTSDASAQYGLFIEGYQSSHYPDDPKLEGGDSGGPLFLVQSDGFRDLKGVHRGMWYTNASNEYIWVDVTVPENAAWIKANARDPDHDAQPTWLAKHAIQLINGQADYWYGEVEYRGDCDRLHDTDCDHWRDDKDNCPNTWNPDQTASYDGAFGDACHGLGGCLCDPDNDVDHDHICAYSCPSTETTTGSRWDNCPTAFNPFQENANVEFERAAVDPVEELGDACDPVPTPQPEPVTRFDSQVCKPIGASSNLPVDLGQVCSAAVLEDHIATTGIAPHVKAPSPPTPIAVNVSIKNTKPRFCQDDLLATKPIVCHAKFALNDDQLTAWADEDAERGDDPTRPWHRITIGGGFFGFRDVPLPSINFGGAPVSTKWFFDQDIQYWATGPNAPKVTGPNMGNCALDDCLNGTLWMNNPTAIGSDSSNATLNGVNIGFHAKGLADGLTSILPKTGLTWCVPPLLPKLTSLSLALVVDAPSSSEMPLTPLLWPSTGTLRFADQRGVNDTQLLVPSGGDMMAALMDDGSMLAVHDLPNGSGGTVNCGGNKVDDTLNSVAFGPAGGLWLSAVEATRVIGGPDAIAIASDGTHLLAQASASGDSFAAALLDPASAGAVADVVAPSARTGFVSFYARSLRGVFVAGGTSNGTVQHDIWLKQLGEGWADVTPHAPPNVAPLGDIVATTFGLRDEALWILDERNVGPVRVTRLLRSPMAGTFQVAASWVGQGKVDRKLLTLDRGGNVLVTLARSRGPGFVTARVTEVAGKLRVTGTYKVPGAKLLAAPISTPKGYLFVVEKNGKQSTQRTAELHQRSPCDLEDDLEDSDE